MRRVRLAAVMRIDHQIHVVGIVLGKIAKLGYRGRIHADNAPHLKIQGNRLYQNAFLHIVGQKAQMCGNLISTNAKRAGSKLLHYVTQSKCRPNGIGIGIAVKKDQRIHRLQKLSGKRL